jgi:putative hydrolase of the HAD superfamily
VKQPAFIFDVGNVLLKWSPPDILRAALPPGTDPARYMSEIFAHRLWVELDRGTYEERDVIPELASRLGSAPEEIAHILSVARESLVPLAPGVALLEELDAAGHPLYCLTNMSRETFARVRAKYNFWTRFRGIVVSGQLRMAKPEAAIYRHTLTTHGLDARSTVFIDDHAANVEGARQLGITAVQYDGGDSCIAQIRALAARV